MLNDGSECIVVVAIFCSVRLIDLSAWYRNHTGVESYIPVKQQGMTKITANSIRIDSNAYAYQKSQNVDECIEAIAACTAVRMGI